MSNSSYDAQAVRSWLQGLQTHIADTLGAFDGKPFATDAWQRAPGEKLRGGGSTRILEGGKFFERAGIGFSDVAGDALPGSASAARLQLAGRGFEAMGVSLVLHPHNPHCPTVHMNVRLLIATKAGEEPVFWFGGGMDLTPYYVVPADATHFHRTLRAACDAHDASFHRRFKRWCDEYFFLPHRGEPRGVGGIFYDHHDSGDFERDFAFTRDVGEALLQVYPKIARHRMDEPWTEEDRTQQLVRRGRYVEFNLLYDRGTMFGFKQGANIETLLSSMPPLAAWT